MAAAYITALWLWPIMNFWKEERNGVHDMDVQLGPVEKTAIGARSYTLPIGEGVRFRRMWNASCERDELSARHYAVELRSAGPSTQVLLSRLLNDNRARSHAWMALQGELSEEVIRSLGQIARDQTQSGRYAAIAILAEATNPKATAELYSASAVHPDDDALRALIHGSEHNKSDIHLSELCAWVCEPQRRDPDRFKDYFGSFMSGSLREISQCRDAGLARALFGQIAKAALAPPPAAGGSSKDIGECLAALAVRLSPGDREAASTLFLVNVASSSSAGTDACLQRVDQVRVLVTLGTESALSGIPACLSTCTKTAGFLEQIIDNTSSVFERSPLKWPDLPILPLNSALILPLMEALLGLGAAVPSYLTRRAGELAILTGGSRGISAVLSRSSLSPDAPSTSEMTIACDEALRAFCQRRTVRDQIAQTALTMFGALPTSPHPATMAYWLTLEKRLTPDGPIQSQAGCIPARLYPSPEAYLAAGFTFGELLPDTRDLVFAKLPSGWSFEIYSTGTAILDQRGKPRVLIGMHAGVICCSMMDESSATDAQTASQYLGQIRVRKLYSDQDDHVFRMERLPPDRAMFFLSGRAFAPGRGGHEMSH